MIATYYKQEGHIESEAGDHYDCRLKETEHLFIAVALSRLVEGKVSLQECYESISTNYRLECVRFGENK